MSKNKKTYEIHTMFGGWTRIDMLLAIYEKAIVAIQAMQTAEENGDTQTYANRMVEAQKCILAIHSGLKPDEHDVAYNIARLLNFILLCLEKKDFNEAVRFLEKLRSSFAQIHEEATKLETHGVVPPLHKAPHSVSSLV